MWRKFTQEWIVNTEHGDTFFSETVYSCQVGQYFVSVKFNTLSPGEYKSFFNIFKAIGSYRSLAEAQVACRAAMRQHIENLLVKVDEVQVDGRYAVECQ